MVGPGAALGLYYADRQSLSMQIEAESVMIHPVEEEPLLPPESNDEERVKEKPSKRENIPIPASPKTRGNRLQQAR